MMWISIAVFAVTLQGLGQALGEGEVILTVSKVALDRERLGVDPCTQEMDDQYPMGPLVPCSFLPDEFIECNTPELLPPAHNDTLDAGFCSRFGGQRAEDVEWTWVACRALPCIECRGRRHFFKRTPCIKYTGHYFLSTLLYSIFLGVVAVDRFCLGYSAIAVGKLMTLGGLGVWWIIDIFLLVTGNLTPADDSNWEPYY